MHEFTGSGQPLSDAGMRMGLGAVGLMPADVWAVLSVETSGCGFLPDRRPKILFERHIFSRLTLHRFDADDPDISQPTAGGYGPSGAHQFERLAAAIQLDRTAALSSASWGLGQIMGENFVQAGFAGVEEMVRAMVLSEDSQLRAMMAFLQASGCADPLRRHDWASFARLYNGPNYAANNYDGLLAQFYGRFTDGNLPDLRVRASQVYLTYKGFGPLSIDGVSGPRTTSAIKAFQASIDTPTTGAIDDSLLAALGR